MKITDTRGTLIASFFACSIICTAITCTAKAETLYLDCELESELKSLKIGFSLSPPSKEGTVNEYDENAIYEARAQFTPELIIVDHKEKAGPSYFWMKYEINRSSGILVRQNKFLGDTSSETWESKAWSKPIYGKCQKRTVKTAF